MTQLSSIAATVLRGMAKSGAKAAMTLDEVHGLTRGVKKTDVEAALKDLVKANLVQVGKFDYRQSAIRRRDGLSWTEDLFIVTLRGQVLAESEAS